MGVERGSSGSDAGQSDGSAESGLDALVKEVARLPDRVAHSPGQIVAGRFRLDALLGEGGMGAVWAATHTVTRRRVALKFLKGAYPRAELRARFMREARAAALVDHPNAIRVSDFFELDDHTPVMVMELLEGESLRARLERSGPLDVPEAAAILLPVVSAVGTAHTFGIVHRDLKPDNVFLAKEGAATQVKVLDFGIAKLVGEQEGGGGMVTDTGAVLGTPCYMAPEQGLGEKDLDHRADVWAIGVIAYEMLAGCKPVEGDNLVQIAIRLAAEGITPLAAAAPGVPSDVASLVDRMLARDRVKRPPLSEVAAVLSAHASVRVPDFGAPGTAAPADADASTEGESEVPGAKIVVVAPTADPQAATHDMLTPSAVVGPPGGTKPGLQRAALLFAIGLVAAAIVAWQSLRTPAPAAGPREGLPLASERIGAAAAPPPSSGVPVAATAATGAATTPAPPEPAPRTSASSVAGARAPAPSRIPKPEALASASSGPPPPRAPPVASAPAPAPTSAPQSGLVTETPF